MTANPFNFRSYETKSSLSRELFFFFTLRAFGAKRRAMVSTSEMFHCEDWVKMERCVTRP